MVTEAPSMSIHDDDDFETEQDVRALKRAADIRSDPARQSKVAAMIDKQREELDRAAGSIDKPAQQGFRRVSS